MTWDVNKPDLKHSLITEVLLEHADKRSNKIAVIHERDGSEPESITYRELIDTSLRLASGLHRRNLNGKTVGLLLPAGLQFATALLGCFFCGAIAVPLAPVGRRKSRAENIMRTIANCNAEIVITTNNDLILSLIHI